MLGVIMAIIDTSIVNVALPNMAGNLGAATDEISWVATGYILANVVIMPLNGYLTQLLGRKKFYALSLAVFTIASFMCGTAGDVWMLVFWRVVQGIGGGALQPTAQAILFESYPPEKRGAAMAIFGMGAMVGPAIGPTIGGAIVDNFSWPLIFYINIPIGILAFVMTMLFIRDPAYIVKPERGPDWIGMGAMTVGIASLQYVLERGQREDWFSSASICTLTLVGVVSLGFFIVRELRDPHPFVDLKVFGSRTFAAGTVIGVVSGFGLYGLNLVLPLFFQNVLGFDALQTGYALLPGAIATMISMPIAGRLTSIMDPRLEIAIGLAMFGVGSWWMADLNQYAGFWDIFAPRALQGFALGFLFVPLTTVALSGIPRGDVECDRAVHARAPTWRQPRHRDSRTDSNASRRFRTKRVRRERDALERTGRIDAPQRGQSGTSRGATRLDGRAERDRRIVRLRVPHLRDRVLHLDPDRHDPRKPEEGRRRSG